MYRENNLYLLLRAVNYIEKQKIINSTGWKRKRSYLKREKGVNCGKKIKRDAEYLADPIEIIYRCCEFSIVK